MRRRHGRKNLDFDTVVDRKNTRSLKYDFAKKRGKPEDILPLWVADMDFKVSSYITEALDAMNAHGIFGYSETKEEYFNIVKNWMKRHYDWEVDEAWLVKTPGIVYALAMAVKAYTKENEAVLIQPPVYYPFTEVVEDNHRRLVVSELKQSTDGKYYIDYEDFENKVVTENVKLFLLCNPHNPVGRVWTKEELSKIGDICKKHHVLVVSDEIHADFVYKHPHTVFAKVREEYKDIAVIKYIKSNADYMEKFLSERLPKVKMTELEGTYLVWLDFRAYGLCDSELNQRIIYKAGLWLDGGNMFGKPGEGFQRINIACPRSTLTAALEKLAFAFENIG